MSDRASWRFPTGAVNTGQWIERLITAGFAALILLGAAILFGCFVLMFVEVWGAIL